MLTEVRGNCEGDHERWVVDPGIVCSLRYARATRAAPDVTRRALWLKPSAAGYSNHFACHTSPTCDLNSHEIVGALATARMCDSPHRETATRACRRSRCRFGPARLPASRLASSRRGKSRIDRV